MLFKVVRNVRSFSTLATALSEKLDYPSACLNHDLIVQRQALYCTIYDTRIRVRRRLDAKRAS